MKKVELNSAFYLWSKNNVQQQIKSRQRVTDHGEVFTAEREVKAMCDLVAQECDRIDSRFLDIKTPRLIQFNYSSADFAA
ncbi:MAG: hypothetical protein ACI4JV_01045 [Ruminiclostridium sp.]